VLRSLFLAALLLPLAGACSKKLEPRTLSDGVSDQFDRGQVWTYLTRPDEPDSRLTVIKVDHSEKFGNIIHIRVDGIRFEIPGGEPITHLPHLPITEEMLAMSVTEHEGDAEIPLDSQRNYERWRGEFLGGRGAGCFEDMVSGVLDLADTAVRQGFNGLAVPQ